MHTAVIYEGAPGLRVQSDSMTILAVADDSELIKVAVGQVEAGADRIELCGGIGAVSFAAVRAAVGRTAQVGLNRYGFESLDAIAAYKRAYFSGRPTAEAFFYRVPDGETKPDRVDHEQTRFVAVDGDNDVALATLDFVSDLGPNGVGLIELYGGLGASAAAAAVEASRGLVPVGFVGYDAD